MMRMKWMLTTFILIGMAALTGAAAYGQADAPANGQSSTAPSGRTAAASSIQTDVGVSGYETFTSATSGLGTQQTPSNSPGGMVEARQIVNPLVGYELTFSFNPAKQAYAPKAGACALVCQEPPTTISANAIEIGIDYVVSKKIGRLRPFLVGGMGFFITVPGPTPYGNNTIVRPTYIYGGGVDWTLTSHLGLRAQYRGNYYKAPNISLIYPATGVLTQTAEPMAGVYYRF